MRLGQGAPDLFRRKGHFAFDDDGAGFGRGAHWSILFSKSSRASKRLLPEAGHLAGPVDQRRQRARLGAVMGLAAVLAVAHQARLFQHAQMLGDRRLRDPGPRGQRPHRLLAVAAQPLEDRPPGGIGQGLEQEIAGSRQNIAHGLFVLFITAQLYVSQDKRPGRRQPGLRYHVRISARVAGRSCSRPARYGSSADPFHAPCLWRRAGR